MTAGAIVFDFYGTLAHMVPGSQPSFAEVLARRGYETAAGVAEAELWDPLDGVDHREHSASEEAYAAYLRRHHASVLRRCGVGSDDLERVLDDVTSWQHGFEMAAYPDTAAALAALRARGLRLAICSNWDWDLEGFLAQTGLAGRFDVQVHSATAGWRKPNAEIYRHTLELLDVAPADAVFVGDTWSCDVEGPRDAGLRPVHLWRDDHRDRQPPALPDGVARISTLAELETLL